MNVQPARISTASLDYVKARVTARESGALVDPTADPVTMAFKTSGTPSGGDWKTAEWETDAVSNPQAPAYFARCLVGTGGTIVLAAGTYHVWVKVADSPETPVLKAGPLVVF